MDEVSAEKHQGVVVVITPDKSKLKSMVHQSGHLLIDGKSQTKLVGNWNKGNRKEMFVWRKKKNNLTP